MMMLEKAQRLNHTSSGVMATESVDDEGVMVEDALCDCAGNSKVRPPDQIGRIW